MCVLCILTGISIKCYKLSFFPLLIAPPPPRAIATALFCVPYFVYSFLLSCFYFPFTGILRFVLFICFVAEYFYCLLLHSNSAVASVDSNTQSILLMLATRVLLFGQQTRFYRRLLLFSTKHKTLCQKCLAPLALY